MQLTNLKTQKSKSPPYDFNRHKTESSNVSVAASEKIPVITNDRRNIVVAGILKEQVAFFLQMQNSKKNQLVSSVLASASGCEFVSYFPEGRNESLDGYRDSLSLYEEA
ncbi:hypothetical protein QL285_087347 [Trifolium repens]|nr:hypothetical protein QL285_087347 [Trifolium repens]